MLKINAKQQKIISLLLKKDRLASLAIHTTLAKQNDGASLVTVKRMLSLLVKNKVIATIGSGLIVYVLWDEFLPLLTPKNIARLNQMNVMV